MNVVVVDVPQEWSLDMAGVTVVSARSYLFDAAWNRPGGLRICNLCKSSRYQGLGHYVSLLAEARGHVPFPRAEAIEDLRSQDLVRKLAGELCDLLDDSLTPSDEAPFSLDIYFGRSASARFAALSRAIFDLFRVPLLRAVFAREAGVWHIRNVRPIGANEIVPEQRDFALAATRRHLARQRPPLHLPQLNLAILRDPGSDCPASNDVAIGKFGAAARAFGLHVELLGRDDLSRLPRFDGLFIRDNTFVKHYTYRFSRHAAAAGMVVIDDPASILRCNNKVYLAELLPHHGIPIPRTLIVHRDNLADIVPTLGLPCVLKRPDSSLSLGVVKAESPEQLQAAVTDMLAQSDLIVAQEYLPTPFDWRVGVLDGKPLFVCKYHMVPGHWQIMRHTAGKHYEEGRTEALHLSDAPLRVIELALEAARLIGDGFYGIDIKAVTADDFRVIEVNDNPNVDAGNEDDMLKDALYMEVMSVFARRMAVRRQRSS